MHEAQTSPQTPTGPPHLSAPEMLALPRVQDLRNARLPRGFRGRSAAFVQLWWLVQASLWRMSPQILYGWRRWLLRLFGCQVGRGVKIRPTATITYPWKVRVGDWSWIGDDVTLYSLGRIEIGHDVVVSQNSYICAAGHDMASPTFDIYARAVTIEPEAWIASDVFVAPGVTIGRGAVVGARSSVFGDVEARMVYRGNPARMTRPRPTRSH